MNLIVPLSLAFTVVLSMPLDKANTLPRLQKKIDDILISVNKRHTSLSLQKRIDAILISVNQGNASFTLDAFSVFLGSAKELTEILKTITEGYLDPHLKAIRAEITDINTNIRGITTYEKNLIRNALKLLFDSESTILAVRTLLKALATETISKSSKLRRIISKIEDELPENRMKKILAFTANHMSDLMERSKELLAQAQTKYTETTASLNAVRADLERFKKSVKELKDGPTNKRWKEMGEFWQSISHFCWFVPISCPLVYTQIKIYQEELALLERTVKNSMEDTVALIFRVDERRDFVHEEITLILVWEGLLKGMSTTFGSADDLAFEIDFLGKEEVLKQLTKLEEASQNYINHTFETSELKNNGKEAALNQLKSLDASQNYINYTFETSELKNIM